MPTPPDPFDPPLHRYELPLALPAAPRTRCVWFHVEGVAADDLVDFELHVGGRVVQALRADRRLLAHRLTAGAMLEAIARLSGRSALAFEHCAVPGEEALPASVVLWLQAARGSCALQVRSESA